MREDLELALRLLTQEFHAGGISGDRAQVIAAIRRCLLRMPCEACAAAPIGQACSLEHAELVRDVVSLLIAEPGRSKTLVRRLTPSHKSIFGDASS